ncbi:MAG: UDP-N-acetylglucosamine 1-carboxyvinyltransferase [Firmicutes bacterium ML8_F2]|jgi:UDP-N-acetylglucosamine 1-carboxyvinyltransferase|nr:MAG: UDP-N-acetylglucosamine 1-carboxyvinyltransferase [Firmicutes bacterium ML8_F2]
MKKYIIQGKTNLSGKVKISGSKNAAVAILPAAILTSENLFIDNLPDITDVRTMVAILENLGVTIRRRGRNAIELIPGNLARIAPAYELVKRMRASYYFMGSLLARFGRAEVPIPGGCDLGPRPIDQHLKGFSALGADIKIEHGMINLSAERLKGANIYLDVVTIGATINLMLAAVVAEGRTVLENAAKEPEIVDLANFLNAMGAKIRGAGTDVIRIDGVKKFSGVRHAVIPDRIEAGTFMLAAAATGGTVTVEDVIPKHLEAITAKLREVGAKVQVEPERITVTGTGNLVASDLKTFPYPGFPTDLQPPGMVLLTAARGLSVVTENVFDGRFNQVDELKRMGARIKVEGRTALVEGGGNLSGAPVTAPDLRSGAALIIAALMADGTTEIGAIEHVDRGYEILEDKLISLGASIKRISEGDLMQMPGEFPR